MMRLVEEAPRSLMHAACKGANPDLFNATSGSVVFDALSYCDRCDVIQECHDYVRPVKSLFDGVCAASVWCNGLVIQPALFDEGEE